MASEIRVNQITSRTGVSTVSFTDSGPVISGVTTVQGSLNVADGITGNQITVGDTFLTPTSIGIGTTNTTGRSAGINTAQGTLIYNSDTGSVQVYNGNSWSDVGKEAMNATGGLVNEYVEGGRVYRAHIFTSSASFNVLSAPPSATVDYLVVGGGGGGSPKRGGGGGAGGFRIGSGSPITVSSYTVTVGGGGAAAELVPTNQSASGSPSIFSTTTSQGGGAGGADAAPPIAGGVPGGSGGGACQRARTDWGATV